MGDKTGIEWNTDKSLDQPLRWRKPRRIFVNSMSDLFHESVPDEWIDKIFAVMALCPQHTFQVLTKRPERMRTYLARLSLLCTDSEDGIAPMVEAVADIVGVDPRLMPDVWPLPHIWFGVSVEDQATADERVPLLLDTPAAKRFISAEPLLGPLDLLSVKGGTLWIGGQRGCGGMHRGDGSPDCPREPHHHHDERCGAGLDWVIVGGESGPNARPMHPDWVRSLRDQCAAAGTAFFFKQWGEWVSVSEVEGAGAHFHFEDGATVRRVGKKSAGHLIDGREHREFPA